MDKSLKYSVNLSFEEIKLPAFQDILVLAKNSPHGVIGISKSFELLAPNDFEFIKIEHDKVEALLINKRILAKISMEKVTDILKEKVFCFISDGEILKVDFKVIASCVIE